MRMHISMVRQEIHNYVQCEVSTDAVQLVSVALSAVAGHCAAHVLRRNRARVAITYRPRRRVATVAVTVTTTRATASF